MDPDPAPLKLDQNDNILFLKMRIRHKNGPFSVKMDRFEPDPQKKKKEADPDPRPWWGANPNMVRRLVKVARFGPFSRDCIGDSFRVSRRFHFSTTAMNGFVRQIAFDNSRTKMPWPGFEPGLLRPQRRVLTTRRSRLSPNRWWAPACQLVSMVVDG